MSDVSEDEEQFLRKLKRAKKAAKNTGVPASATKKIRRAIRRVKEIIDAKS